MADAEARVNELVDAMTSMSAPAGERPAEPTRIARLHFGSSMTDGGHRAAAFAGAVEAAERLGARVTVREVRDGSDRVWGLEAHASLPVPRPISGAADAER